ncbi:TPA: haloacid dehalogenase type II, partial [Candidatus Poribacteria bacterium]|nr:haloacid dehalogenase type II [Candidatus Poribacteria bacterium]
MKPSEKIKALTFDVFGTVSDWRSSIVDEGEVLNHKWQKKIDWEAFALAWRGLYEPSMEIVRQGKRPWVILDVLHREILLSLLPKFSLDDLKESEIDHLNYVWHRLKPWPDCVEGLSLLKFFFIIAALSNGNVALITNM